MPTDFAQTTAYAFAAGTLRVSHGVQAGDALGAWQDAVAGDVYRLQPDAQAMRLRFDSGHVLAAGSDLGQAGDVIEALGQLTFLAGDGERVEVLLARHAASGLDLVLPLSPLAPRGEYTLIAAGPPPARVRLADALCVAFAAGTLIARPDAAPIPIDRLQPGDAVLTRDHGAQAVRWIGKASFRAQGGFAPVVIAAGTMGNLGDLVVSPHHRLFLYKPRGASGAAEILVQAKHLVNGTVITRREGGIVDYYSLVFDRHEIIYAEGVAAESLMVNDMTLGLLPPELSEDLRKRLPDLNQTQHRGTEVGAGMLPDLGESRPKPR